MTANSDTQSEALSPAEAWFATQGWQPFPFQRQVWQAYLRGESGLIHAATGTGKTYAAWLGPLLEWRMENGEWRKQPVTTHNESSKGKILTSHFSTLNAPPLRVLWLTPLRALAADTETALREPLAALAPGWTLETRTGDTASSVRARQRQRLPSALITTPESLSLLLARTDAASLFRELRLVVVDEWHELLGSKRGVQLELALARLRTWQTNLRTWGLSATLGNLDVALAALLGIADSPEANAEAQSSGGAEHLTDRRPETGDRSQISKAESTITSPPSLSPAAFSAVNNNISADSAASAVSKNSASSASSAVES
ncbi:MAG: DEAD/DEAH box helicase, partial [Chloroflexaceae bacterium]|nr:DEAD/DEAH box helicase [Chloroflexaceae bacterium]